MAENETPDPPIRSVSPARRAIATRNDQVTRVPVVEPVWRRSRPRLLRQRCTDKEPTKIWFGSEEADITELRRRISTRTHRATLAAQASEESYVCTSRIQQIRWANRFALQAAIPVVCKTEFTSICGAKSVSIFKWNCTFYITHVGWYENNTLINKYGWFWWI